uniref:Uncharacterized protein n=1 Tax=Moniliophthora roreri TaxID=221103 RepID=A0A0W0EWP7_MONRR
MTQASGPEVISRRYEPEEACLHLNLEAYSVFGDRDMRDAMLSRTTYTYRCEGEVLNVKADTSVDMENLKALVYFPFFQHGRPFQDQAPSVSVLTSGLIEATLPRTRINFFKSCSIKANGVVLTLMHKYSDPRLTDMVTMD